MSMVFIPSDLKVGGDEYHVRKVRRAYAHNVMRMYEAITLSRRNTCQQTEKWICSVDTDAQNSGLCCLI